MSLNSCSEPGRPSDSFLLRARHQLQIKLRATMFQADHLGMSKLPFLYRECYVKIIITCNHGPYKLEPSIQVHPHPISVRRKVEVDSRVLVCPAVTLVPGRTLAVANSVAITFGNFTTSLGMHVTLLVAWTAYLLPQKPYDYPVYHSVQASPIKPKPKRPRFCSY